MLYWFRLGVSGTFITIVFEKLVISNRFFYDGYHVFIFFLLLLRGMRIMWFFNYIA